MLRPTLCLALASLALPAARATKGFPLPMMGFNSASRVSMRALRIFLVCCLLHTPDPCLLVAPGRKNPGTPPPRPLLTRRPAAACNVGCGNYSFPNEAFVIKTAEAMVTLGLKDAGWGYVNLDDGWAAVQRNAAGQQVAVSRKFPGGMASLAAKVHGMGLRFGLYTALASQTCGGLYMAGEGSCDNEVRDALQYGNWSVDYVKDDGCGGCHGDAPDPALASYAAMQAGITASGRDIYLTTEASPNLTRHSERPDLYGNSHRTGHDSQPAWGSVMTQMDIASNLWGLVHN